MPPFTAAALVAMLYVLHQDFWFWREARPLVFGFLPIGLFYHAAFTAACSIVLGWLVMFAWPAHLEGVTADVRSDAPDLKIGPTTTADLKIGPTPMPDPRVGPDRR